LKFPSLNGTIDGSAADGGPVNGHAISGGTIDRGGIVGAIGGVGPVDCDAIGFGSAFDGDEIDGVVVIDGRRRDRRCRDHRHSRLQ
jgi:hypothetical protein